MNWVAHCETVMLLDVALNFPSDSRLTTYRLPSLPAPTASGRVIAVLGHQGVTVNESRVRIAKLG